MLSTHVIITAAGKGSRFGSELPKQFQPLGPSGYPVLMYSINAFLDFGIPFGNIIVTLSGDDVAIWEELCSKYGYVTPRVIIGGSTRFESVNNALMNIEIKAGKKILIHDGARPLVSRDVISRVWEELNHCTGVVPTVPVTDSLRRVEATTGNTVAVDRALYCAVQTPQGFEAETIYNAYRQGYKPTFTDDASVVEHYGTVIRQVEGDRRNIKITVADDLIIANAFLESQRN
ncbi:MAG: 2-C-methyl-D-erythritol 4-phosphate cytidylyltransferase [Muribaculaceae bacterium]|nr:2-C-methyl-D-erythritol 4-phosphate cytidylyltransferase [Muribaculaceae bacterium]